MQGMISVQNPVWQEFLKLFFLNGKIWYAFV